MASITAPHEKVTPVPKEERRLEQWFGPEWARLIRGVFTNPLSVTGLIIILLFVLVGVFAPFIISGPTENWDSSLIPRDGFRDEPEPPGTPWERNPPRVVPAWYRTVTGNDEWVHLFGTTAGQYDIFYAIVWGTRTALTVGTIVVLISVTIGLTLGSIAGFYGGFVDEIFLRIVEIFTAFPFLVAVLVLASVLVPKFGSNNIWAAVIALIVFGWTGYARQIRGDIFAVKELEYVQASRASGAPDARLIIQHILPNAIFPTLVLISLDMGAIVLSFAALSFLGVGAPPGYADWGQIVSGARSYIVTLNTHWYTIVYPGIALLLYGMGWNLVGDALRDILDPKLRGG